MFAGHIGAALAIGRAERRVNIGAFIFAALLMDIALWLFILVGWESATISEDFVSTHQAEFVFPFSHGLLASIAWSALAGSLVYWFHRSNEYRSRAAMFVAAAVLSHWLLDAIVHIPELPLIGAGSPLVGFALWRNLPVALAFEAFVVILGLWMFIAGSRLTRGRKIALSALTLLVLVLTVAGMTLAPPPPSAKTMAASSLVTILVVVAISFWIGKVTGERRD